MGYPISTILASGYDEAVAAMRTVAVGAAHRGAVALRSLDG